MGGEYEEARVCRLKTSWTNCDPEDSTTTPPDDHRTKKYHKQKGLDAETKHLEAEPVPTRGLGVFMGWRSDGGLRW